MRERYPHKTPINDAIRRIENPLHDEMMAIYNLGFEYGKIDVLEKIRAEIANLDNLNPTYLSDGRYTIDKTKVLEIIDKYKAECEDNIK